MRVGQNPAKFVSTVPKPARVTVAIITYIPFLDGYYAESLEVLKTCLRSIWNHTETPFDLLVFDNASCEEVRTFLGEAHKEGKIQYLVLSENNIGKVAAWNFIFSASPGEIVAYADSDIYFKPGWLTALLAVLEKYPKAGMVTGMPMWSPEKFSTSTIQWALDDPGINLKRGKLLSWEDYWTHAQSLGQDEATARSNFASQEDICISHNGDRYYVGAGHFQFVCRKSILRQIIPMKAERPMGQVRQLDVAINGKGYLRLATSRWWVNHLGNTVTDFKSDHSRINRPATRTNKIRGPLRRVIQWIYHKSFNLLYRN
jgi:glycosyltransferase involved in cell wall biosynthesis